MTNWETEEGAPNPLGVSWIEHEQACNFALYSKHAEEVSLLLYREDDLERPALTYRLDYLKNKSGSIWHCRIPAGQLCGAKYYAYCIGGPPPGPGHAWHNFDPEKILLDPYAKAVFFPPRFDRRAACGPGSNAGRAPLGVIRVDGQAFDWGNDMPVRHGSDLVIYEMHVGGFTKHRNSGVPATMRGKFSGVIARIPHLRELGVTAVELMPVQQFDPQEGSFWGYMTLNFFTPHHGYAVSSNDGRHLDEFRRMVKALHAAGIEVILDVVYNHTTEGDHFGPVYSFKGIDASTYYMTSGNRDRPFSNYTGTGNTLHTANRTVRRLIVDSLRYWVREMHVDGFRFDLASIFTHNSDGSINLTDPPIFAEISSDPDLAAVRLIAEPWEPGQSLLVGQKFPSLRWRLWNSQFRDTAQRFVRSDPGMVADLMTLLYGSCDLFPDDLAHACRPYQSVNYVTSHDGFTLYDLVSYSHKHNEANGHGNKDGPEDFSWNGGWEGDHQVPAEIIRLRKRQIKNFCCLLFVANGTPMFRMGDEFMQTQRGNNNPYNQDNETSWLDWSRLDSNRDVFRFFQKMIAFRKAHPSLGRSTFWRDDVRWYGAGRPVDMSFPSRALAFCLRGESTGDSDIYVMINAYWKPLRFAIQEGSPGRWKCAIDTALTSPNDIVEPGQEVTITTPDYLVQGRSVVILLSDGESFD